MQVKQNHNAFLVSSPSFIPAIALSAYAGEYDQRQPMKAGFQKH
ncbi:MAG: hypothetical protein RM338_04815 [Nostoc sp. DedQUE12a]|nr:hypothetical protein [Nostoc sp. DedQUE12a]